MGLAPEVSVPEWMPMGALGMLGVDLHFGIGTSSIYAAGSRRHIGLRDDRPILLLPITPPSSLRAQMIAKALLLLAALPLASADVPISVALYESADCSGTPTVQGTAADPLTDAETTSGSSHPAGMCIGGNSLGGGVSFMGSCPSLDTTTTQQYDVDTSTLMQQGMRWCWMANADCSGSCTSSAVFTEVADWSVPACQSHTAVFGGPSDYGINSVKISCGDAVNPSPPPPADSGAGDSDPCFPSSSIVTKADGTPSRIDALKEGDEIVAATHDGTLTTDTVSLLSIAKPEVKGAAYVALATDAKKTLTLTPGHHVPVGAACCSTLKLAKDVEVGENVGGEGRRGHGHHRHRQDPRQGDGPPLARADQRRLPGRRRRRHVL